MMRWLALALMLPAVAHAQAPIAPPPEAPPPVLPTPAFGLQTAPPPVVLDDGGTGESVAPPTASVPVLSGWPDGGRCESESPDELYGKAHLERAIRAELDGKLDDAHLEAQAGLAASPKGRYAPATAELDARVRALGLETGASPARAELAIAGTIEGITAGALFAGGLGADSKGAAGLVMAGSALGLGAPLLLSSQFKIRQTVPVMLESGAVYGVSVALLGESIGDGRDSAIPAAVGMVGGSLAGVLLGESLHLSLGDAGGAFSGVLLLGGGSALIGSAAGLTDHDLETVVLIGASLGVIGGPALNHALLGWSRSRWILVMLGGGVGVVFGGGLAVLAGVTDGQVGTAAAFAGLAVGTGLTAWFTRGMAPDDTPPPEGTALLRVTPDGRIGLGLPSPRVLLAAERRVGVGLDVVGGRF